MICCEIKLNLNALSQCHSHDWRAHMETSHNLYTLFVHINVEYFMSLAQCMAKVMDKSHSNKD